MISTSSTSGFKITVGATAISISILYSGVWFSAPSEACFGDLVAESMGDWEKESAVWS